MGVIRSAGDYLHALFALLPPGPAWSREAGTRLYRLLTGLAQEPARLEAAAWDLIEQADPRTSTALLDAWERVAGLTPAAGATLAQRRAAVVGVLTATGGQSRAYYAAVAAAMGYSITITEYRPATVLSPVNAPIYGVAWAFAWRVVATAQTGAATPAALEAQINKIKPAHTVVYFVYP